MPDRKMFTDEEIESLAEDHVRKTYPADCEILSREKKSDPDGIYFVANRREVDPDDWQKMYCGDGGFFVHRASGEIWGFGSGQIVHEGLDYWLKFHAEGWHLGPYRLTVREVADPRRFAQLVVKQHVRYLVRELDSGAVWKTYLDYDQNTVLRRLESLPCSFAMEAKQLRAILPVLLQENVADFDYCRIDAPKKYDWRPENNAPDLLGPQWDELGL